MLLLSPLNMVSKPGSNENIFVKKWTILYRFLGDKRSIANINLNKTKLLAMIFTGSLNLPQCKFFKYKTMSVPNFIFQAESFFR